MGFLLVYLGLEGSIPVNPGQFIRALLLVCLSYSLIKEQFQHPTTVNKLFFITFLYLLGISIVVGVQNGSLSGIFVDFYNASKILFVLLLAFFVQKEWRFFYAKSGKIININFLILTGNLFFSYLTGIGLETYDYAETSTKGFLYGGNVASVLTLIFFIYYFFQIKKGKKYQLYSILALIAIYIVGTKVIFLVPGIVAFYFLLKVDWSYFRIAAVSMVLLPLLVYLFFLTQPLFSVLIESRYLETLQRTGLLGEEGAGSYNELLLTYRRTAAAIEQLSVQINDFLGFLFGYGEVGQQAFWAVRGVYAFNFAAMDFFDLMFQYGFIGAGLFFSFAGIALVNVWEKGMDKPLGVSFLFIFLYSFFGGYVLYSVTAGTLFAFLMGLIMKNQIVRTRLVRKRNLNKKKSTEL